MKFNDPDRGWCGDPKRGAAMGRVSDLDTNDPGPLVIRPVPLDGDYDPGGTYWGCNSPGQILYCVQNPEAGEERYLRAKSLDAAKSKFSRATWTPAPIDPETELPAFLQAYLECAIWSTCGDDPDFNGPEENNPGGVPLDDLGYSTDDIDGETVAKMKADCLKFLAHAAPYLADADIFQAGHDFWLDRNGHGTGFWDGDYVHRDKLSEIADSFGTFDLYVHAGKVHGQ